jgi:hypothetical protein
MPTRIASLALLALTLGAPLLEAQRPIYRQARVEEQNSRVGFSARVMLGVDLSLSNLGSVSYPELSPGLEREGRTGYQFSDGALLVDIVGYDANNNPILADATANFQFAYENATIARVPTSFDQHQDAIVDFSLSRYRSASFGATGEADGESNYGWEITYQYEFGKSTDRLRFGFIGGVAINNLDFSYAGTVQGDAFVQSFVLRPNRPIILGPNDNRTGFWSSGQDDGYEIDLDENPIDLNAPDDRFLDYGNDGLAPVIAEVASNFDYDGILAMLRLGPSVNLRIIDHVHAELSAGLVGVYLNSRIRLDQVLLNLPTLPSDPGDVFEQDRSDYLLGYFAEGLLRYQMTPRVGFYGSLMYLKVQDLGNTTIGDVHYDLSLQSPMFATAGMRLVF